MLRLVAEKRLGKNEEKENADFHVNRNQFKLSQQPNKQEIPRKKKKKKREPVPESLETSFPDPRPMKSLSISKERRSTWTKMKIRRNYRKHKRKNAAFAATAAGGLLMNQEYRKS